MCSVVCIRHTGRLGFMPHPDYNNGHYKISYKIIVRSDLILLCIKASKVY